MNIPACVSKRMDEYCKIIEKHSPKLASLYRNCYPNTLETATEILDDGSIFVLTGDIPAMWLRDSTAEVSHYIPLAKDNADIRDIIGGVIRKQREYISLEPYANAYKKEPNDHREFDDMPLNHPIVWERKYEIDSLCYPVNLAYHFWKASETATLFSTA